MFCFLLLSVEDATLNLLRMFPMSLRYYASILTRSSLFYVQYNYVPVQSLFELGFFLYCWYVLNLFRLFSLVIVTIKQIPLGKTKTKWPVLDLIRKMEVIVWLRGEESMIKKYNERGRGRRKVSGNRLLYKSVKLFF